jgi:hypothetical protein
MEENPKNLRAEGKEELGILTLEEYQQEFI